MNILVADDDSAIRKLVTHYLTFEGYQVVTANDGAEAIKKLAEEQIQLAIIDLMMPKKDGYAVCGYIREHYDIPVIMLTAKDQLVDKEKGFFVGTDDYLTKPFEPQELLFRMRALLRRFQDVNQKTITIGQLIIDKNAYVVKENDKEWLLPVKEFELLFYLASYPNRIFTREDLIRSIWGEDYAGMDRTVDVHIKRLRTHFDSSSGIIITTVRGVGYKLEVLK